MTDKDAKSELDRQVSQLINVLQKQETKASIAGEWLDNESLMASFSEDFELICGQQVGHWRVEKLLGLGGMSAVYQVSRSDDQLEQTAALKLIFEQYIYTNIKDRFLKERQILTNLNHPNIVKLLDAGITSSGLPWFVMEKVDGLNIKQHCDQHSLTTDEIIELMLPVCDALSYSHSLGVVHRDIKPSNVIVSPSGQVKLVDFGIAHENTKQQNELTQTGMVIGTPNYMSPEQAKGLTNEISPATDIFSMGVMLCELVTENQPFDGDTASEVAYHIIHHEPNLNANVLDRDLHAIVYKCLEKDPVKRYASIEALQSDLIARKKNQVIAARPITNWYRFRKFIKRNPISSTLVMVLATGLLSGGIYLVHQTIQNQSQLAFTESIINQANQISADITQTHLLPLHNVQDTYLELQGRAEQLSDQVEEQANLAGGSAYNALGTAFLNMRKYKEAKSYFRQAESLGYQNSDLAKGMAIILSGEWREALRKKPTEEKKNELTGTLFDPLMTYLEQSKSDDDFRHFANANIAYLNNNFDDAIDLFDQAHQNNPSFYEALRMKSESQLRKFSLAAATNGYTAELATLQASNQSLQDAINIGRSDPYNYVSLCTNKSVEVQILSFSKQNDELPEAITSAEQICLDALKLDPKLKSPWTTMSTILMSGLGLAESNDDKQNLFNKVLNMLNDAIIQHPDDERIHLAKIRPLMGLASIKSDSGENPLPMFEDALQALNEVKSILPDLTNRWFFESGRVHFSQALYFKEQVQYESAIDHFNSAISAYEERQKLNFDNAVALNIGVTLYQVYEIYKAMDEVEIAINKLAESINIRYPIVEKNFSSYFSQFMTLLESNDELIKFKAIHNKITNGDILKFSNKIQIGCDYAEKTSEQFNLLKQYIENLSTMDSIEQPIIKCELK